MEDTAARTPCRDCVFAVYDTVHESRRLTPDLLPPGYRSQTGCRLGRLERFLELGTRVERAEEPDVHSFVVRDRLCLASRHADSPWAKATPPDRWADRVREDLRLRLHVVVPVMTGDTLDQILTTARSLEGMALPARAAHFVLNADGLRPGELVAALRACGPALAWNVRAVAERNPDGTRVDAGRCVDLVADGLDPRDANYYAVFRPGFAVPPSFAADLDEALNGRLERFVLLRARADGQGLVVQTKTHQLAGGNRPSTFEREGADPVRADAVADKVRLMAAEDQVEFLIGDVTAVCPALA